MDFVSWIKDFIKWVCKIFKKGLNAERAEKCLEIHKHCGSDHKDVDIKIDQTNGWHVEIKDHFAQDTSGAKGDQKAEKK